MAENLTSVGVIEEILKVVRKNSDRDNKAILDFLAKVQVNLKWKVTSLEDEFSRFKPFGSSKKGASSLHRGKKDSHRSQLVSSKKNSGSLLSQNVLIYPKSVAPFLTINAQPLYNFNLSIKEPFLADVFKIEKRENNNFYIVLERTSESPDSMLKRYIKKDQTLHVDRLCDDIIRELQDIIRSTQLPGMEIEVEKKRSGVLVHLGSLYEDYGLEISPCIPVSSLIWKDCPALIAIGEIPKLVQKTIRSLREARELVIYVPLSSQVDPSRYEETIKTIVYASVEMEFFLEHEDITAMVKLVKLAWHNFQWCKYGLSELHIRQIAVREADNLCFKTRGEGYSYILKSIKEELATTTTAPDFFVKQAHFGIEEELIGLLLKSIDEALKLLPGDLLSIACNYNQNENDEVI